MLQSPPARTELLVRAGGLRTLFAERLPQQIQRFLTAGVIVAVSKIEGMIHPRSTDVEGSVAWFGSDSSNIDR
jgi:hypothetical protein